MRVFPIGLITALLLAACGSDGSSTTASDGNALADASIATDGPGDGGAPFTPSYLIYEKFNQLPTGSTPPAPWVTVGAVTVQEIPFAVDKSAEIAFAGGTGQASLSVTLPPQSGRVVFEAKVMALETAGFKAIPYIYDGNGNAVASIAFLDGSIIAHVGATTTTVQPFVANAWYRVRVIVDTNTGTFDLFIDGVRKATAQALRQPASAVTSLSYYVDGASGGTLRLDNIKVYNEAQLIGPAPTPTFDPRAYGAAGDGTTNDTRAIQAAIDAAANTGGSVVLKGGTFLSGTLTLRSTMTFFIDSTATLLGSANAADYPTQTPGTGNTQLSNTQRALLYAPNVTQLFIDGGGMIDGQGDSFSGVEATRPLVIWSVLSDHVTVRNVSLRKGAVWSLVSMETDHVLITNVNVASNYITHDGIDVVDGSDVMVDDVAVQAGDDAMCLKSGVRRGIVGMTVQNSLFSGNNGGSNGIKFGTATYGAFQNINIVDDYVKNVQYAAMAVESRQGSDVDSVTFQRIQLANTGAAFFVYLAQQATTHPAGDVPKLGSITNVSFTDILGATGSWPNSPHQGSLITGHIYNGTTYDITNLAFTNVNVRFAGGDQAVPGAPPEAMPNQYPESNMFGDLPAWGYYLRHVAGATFTSVVSTVAATDARPKLVTDDVTGVVGSP